MSIFDKLFGKRKLAKPNPNMPTNEDFAKSIELFNNRKKYKEIDEQVLRSINDDDLLQSIFDFICEEIIKDDYNNAYTKVKSLPIGFQHIYGLWLLEAEVNNGGFNQYFYNNGQFIDESYNGCLAIGAKKTAEIVNKAVETIMKEKEIQLEMRKKGTLEAFSESYKETKLGECDEAFFQNADNLQELQIKYIRNNYTDFIPKTGSS